MASAAGADISGAGSVPTRASPRPGCACSSEHGRWGAGPLRRGCGGRRAESVRAPASSLIGKHGHTIDALQYVANAAVFRGAARGSRYVNSAGYRERRRQTLESIAFAAPPARRAVRACPARADDRVERKVVMSASGLPGVETASEGTEPNRYVVVLPA